MMKIYSLLLAPLVLLLVACGAGKNDEMNLVIESANGDLAKVKMYVGKLDGVNYVSMKGETPLGAATYNGHLDVVKFLVESGAIVSFKNSQGESALDIAKNRGHDEIYEFLSATQR